MFRGMLQGGVADIKYLPQQIIGGGVQHIEMFLG